MAQEIHSYIAEIDKIYRTGNATEHSYRPALQNLLEKITSGLTITNEPKHIACGAPDYIVSQEGIPLGYIEAKDIAVGLLNNANKLQFDRYKRSLGNLIITDYLAFQLFIEGELVASAVIAQEKSGGIIPDNEQHDAFLEIIERFTQYKGKTINRSLDLARMMAAKAKLLAEVIRNALADSESSISAKGGDSDYIDTLSSQLEGFRQILIKNLSVSSFADMYAQTLAYGLFAACLNQRDWTKQRPFNRVMAAQLIPQSNPFLRKFFQYIAGYDLDSRIQWIVDALADLFNYAAVEDIRKEFGKANQDPYIHFYETFLAEYDPALRESRGVYYTPLPVVKFIVKAVDDLLKSEFALKQGLADNSKIKMPVKSTTRQGNQAITEDREFHKVQILDPAAGTGTFLAEVIETIYSGFINKGMWDSYCVDHLIPRLNGFEILMASYAMAHFKLDMTLREDTNFSWNISDNDSAKRFNIYLTNTLEEAPERVPELFMAQWLAQEAGEARRVKRDVPVMVVMGNPPYNVSTQNKNDWIEALIGEYKKEPGTEERLKEQKLNLDDDYVKFIRYGQMLVDRTETGILAYINNHSFLDNPTFRGMRWSLMQSFDKIYILDPHGNSKRKETAPDGSKDENVFDIQIGASINIGIKTGKKTPGSLAEIFHFDLYGRRKAKYDFLYEHTLGSIQWKKLIPETPFYFFVPKDFNNQAAYEKGFSVTKIFSIYNAGVKTDRDSLFIDREKRNLEKRMQKLLSGNYDDQFIKQYAVSDSSSYKLTSLIKSNNYSIKNILPIQYRPFDYRFIYYQPGLTSRPAYTVIKHFLAGENIGLVFLRTMPAFAAWSGVFITDKPVEFGIGGSFPGNTAPIAPLYLYPDKDALDRTANRRPNLNMEIVTKIEAQIGLCFTEEKTEDSNAFAPIDMLDYIYAVLHSSAYREKYKEFLKIDYPRVPYPTDALQFQTLASFGETLRKLHLMETATPSISLALYPVKGSNTVEKLTYKDGTVWINKEQYFEAVPPAVWSFYIGGYQPAQKWLKDRKGATLNFDEIEHYQKIIHVLKLTIDIQMHIDSSGLIA